MGSLIEQYDSALIGILQNEGKIEPFVDAFLGFLYRREMLVQIFRKYESMAAEDEVKRQTLFKGVPSSDCANGTTDSLSSEPHPASGTDVGQHREHQETSVGEEVCPVSQAIPHNDAVHGKGLSSPADVDQRVVQPTQDSVRKTAEESTEDEQKRLQKSYQANAESYNGAVHDNYSWSQSITDTDVRVKVPASVIKGRDVIVDIGRNHLSVKYRQPGGQDWEDGYSGDFTWEVRPEESMWTLNPGQHVHINLEKKEERWWEAVFKHEPKINTRDIDCSRPMSDLDDEAQAKIEEMMYNERQKRLGLPQSHQQKTMGILKQAWDAEGSPFRGQPFDPSAINMDPNGLCFW